MIQGFVGDEFEANQLVVDNENQMNCEYCSKSISMYEINEHELMCSERR